MNETIILTNINEKELFKSIALNGLVSFNTRIFNSTKLAKEVLLRNGYANDKKLINSFKQKCIVYNLLSSITYFANSSFNDADNITKQLNTLRMLCRGDEQTKLKEVLLTDAEFYQKNEALLNLFNTYQDYLNDNNLCDDIDLINIVIKNKYSLNSNCLCFEEDELLPLEEELLKVVSNNKAEKKSLIKYLELITDNKLECLYDDAYGSINEIENIIANISNNNIKYDDVLIILNNPSYFNDLYNISKLYEIPMTFSMGYPISSTNPAIVYDLITKWDKQYNDYNSLLNLFNAKEFNSDLFWNNVSDSTLTPIDKNNILKAVGSLRLSTNKENNQKLINDYNSSTIDEAIKTIVNNFAEELSNGINYLINNYSVNRISYETLDNAAKLKITSTIDEYLNEIKDGKPSDVFEEIISSNILREKSKPGAIAICNLKDALAINRKHIYITGLNAKVFPGQPKENYLLLDNDLEKFKEDNAPTSSKQIDNKKQLLLNVVNFANAAGSKIHLSYSGYSLADLKEENPSSMMFEVFKKEKGDTVDIKEFKKALGKQHTYFEHNISTNKEIGSNYILGKSLLPSYTETDDTKVFNYKKVLSPSAVEKFFECNKKFYLHYVLGITEPEEDDPFVLFPGGTVGTLVHECMEDYGNNPSWSKQEFENNALLKFENYIKQRNTVHKEGLEKNKEEFLNMAIEGYNADPHNIVYKSEYEIGPIKHESGLVFGGRVDRVEKLENGNYIIVDYKTNKKLKHIDEDLDTCFQVVLYAYLLNKQEGFNVESGEFRYLRNPGTFKITITEPVINKMNEKIALLKQAFDTGVFECTDDENNCKYCKYASICGKGQEKENKGDEE